MRAPQEKPPNTVDTMTNGRGVRTHTSQTLDQPTILALLDAAAQKSPEMHPESWSFIVIQDAETLKHYSDLARENWAREAAPHCEVMMSPDFSIFYDATTLIVICAKASGPFVVADCWLAAEHLMLAASAMGFGTCCIEFAVPVLNTPEARAAFGIPVDVIAVAPVIVGVPRGDSREDEGRSDLDILYWK